MCDCEQQSLCVCVYVFGCSAINKCSGGGEGIHAWGWRGGGGVGPSQIAQGQVPGLRFPL